MTYEEERDRKAEQWHEDELSDYTDIVSFKAGADWAIRESSLVKGLVKALDFIAKANKKYAKLNAKEALAQYAAEINRK